MPDESQFNEAAANPSPPQEAAELLRGKPNQARNGPRARRLATAMIGWSENVYRPFLLAMHTFHESVTALRQMHESVGPTIEKDADTQFQADMDAALADLGPEKRKVVSEFVMEAGPGIFSGEVFFTSKAQPDGEQSADGKKERATLDSWEKIEDAFGRDTQVAVEALSLAYRRAVGPNRERLLRGSLLTSAISVLETLMGEIVQHYFLLNPSTMGDEPRFSLKQLQEFDSMEDARYEAARTRAESVAGGDLGDWSKWLEGHPKIKLETHCFDYEALFEAFQRRHILVHNGGRVSRRYQDKVGRIVKGDPPELGTHLDVSADYLEAAFNEIETAGNLILSGVWAKCLAEQMPVIVHQLYIRTYDLMLEGRWQPVKAMCEFAQHGKADQDLLMICKVNGLLADRELGEPIDGTLDRWDVSALDMRFRFAHVCLRNDPDVIAAEIPKSIEQKRLTWDEVLEWPLLGPFRKTPQFGTLAAAQSGPTHGSP
jgi:hypothetical protein